MPAAIPSILDTLRLDTLRLAERLKFELRHSWTSEGRQESVAEHSYQMALLAMLVHPRLEHPVDLGHLADIGTWEPVERKLVYTKTGRFSEHDAFLRAPAEAVIGQAEEKMRAAGIDVEALKDHLARPQQD